MIEELKIKNRPRIFRNDGLLYVLFGPFYPMAGNQIDRKPWEQNLIRITAKG